jgi:antitoxin HigA-1
MVIMLTIRIPKYRPPTHPGDAIHVPYQRINEVVNQKRGITPSTAVRFAKFFGNSSEFWLNLQQNWELYYVLKEEEELKTIAQFKSSEATA